MTEDYCSFETAKLLKVKGFNEQTECIYSNNGELLKLSHLGVKDLTNADCNDYHTWQFPIESVASIISAPSQSMAMKWLREIYKVHIIIDYSVCFSKYSFDVIRLHSTNLTDIEDSFIYDTYEEAAEAAIKYCLENVIK